MKSVFSSVIAAICLSIICSCNSDKEDYSWLKRGIETSVVQLNEMSNLLGDNEQQLIPRSIIRCVDTTYIKQQLDVHRFKRITHYTEPNWERDGKHLMGSIYDWTSGFYAGSLWYVYDITNNQQIKDNAYRHTAILEPVKFVTDNHDVGFMINCSYGNQERLFPSQKSQQIIVQTAESLITRFDESVGVIRSWDFGDWNYPVIIDNMMNLDLLFNASHITGDQKYRAIALKHANTTLSNHFRDDFSSYHVVSYNDDGTIQSKETFQGKNNESAWARGQAWGLYGYVSCYKEQKEPHYLSQIEGIANLIMTKVKNKDFIPYWDLDAIDSHSTPRDASAAAITASALFEFSTLIPNGGQYFNYAEKIIMSLSSQEYLSDKNENGYYILKHSTGSLPHGSEIDVPLNYADYYYLEALQRYMKIKGLNYQML